MSKEELDELLLECAAKLSEHVDTVRIFVTTYDGVKKCDNGRTVGSGSVYAQVGYVKEWLVQVDEAARSRVIKED